MAGYAEHEVAAGERLGAITRHMLGLYAGQPGARRFRQWLSEGARTLGAGAGAVAQVATLMREAAAICV
jgi:tRNA-dihydrouridine synthase A